MAASSCRQLSPATQWVGQWQRWRGWWRLIVAGKGDGGVSGTIAANNPQITTIHRNLPQFTTIHRNTPHQFATVSRNLPQFALIRRNSLLNRGNIIL